MAKKAIFWVMLVMVLAFGMTVVGCDDGSTGFTGDTALNGTWADEDGMELKLNNGSIEISGFMKGTYTTNGSNMTMTITQIHGDMMDGILDSKFYTKNEMKTAMKAYFKTEMGEDWTDEYDAMFDETYGAQLDEMFTSETGTYSISGNQLTVTMGGEPAIFTKK
jgi:hypothetical protein